MKIPDFSQCNIMVYGDVMLDRYWSGNTNRISPEAPVPVVHVQGLQECAGGAGNVALNIAALGCEVNLWGARGRDDAGEALEQALSHAKVQHHLQIIDHLPTITKLRVLSVHQQLLRMDFEEQFHQQDFTASIESCAATMASAHALILSDYAKGFLQDPQALIQAAKQVNLPVLVDPKSDDFSRYAGATLITPNLKEFQQVAGECDSDEAIEQKARNILEQYDLQALLITRSEHGMTMVPRDDRCLHLAAGAREVYDVTGAGDTVMAVMASAIAAGCDMHHASKLANTAAGIVVGRLGAASVSVQEIQRAINQQSVAAQEVAQGIVDIESLIASVVKAQRLGETVVYVSGCFDILHQGHIDYLQAAKALGDRLIVAVHDDAMVAGVADRYTPLNNLQQRTTVLASLGMVDWVLPVEGVEPEQLIQRLLPDVLVKGLLEQDSIAGAESVTYHGGEVVTLDAEQTIKTCDILAKIQHSQAVEA